MTAPQPSEPGSESGVLYPARPPSAFWTSRGTTPFELVLVTLVALAVLLPGIWQYTLVDPWETHYGEVARRMLQDDDWVHTQWQNEGFRSKPVLTFWLMAASMKAMGVADGGGYSGELVASGWTMFAMRLPFVLFGVMGLVSTWWMLASLASRRVAWIALFVVGTTPFYFFVARQAITDMTMVGCLMGTMSCFAMAVEAGDRPITPLFRRVNALHVFLGFLVLIVGWQAIYYGYFFSKYPSTARVGNVPEPAILVGGGVALGLVAMVAWILFLQKTRTQRQVYMYWAWALLGISVLGKGLPALGLSAAIGGLYILLTWRWRLILDLELPRGLALVVLIAVPWHVAMWLKEGAAFIKEYLVDHNFKRAASGVHGDRGTFDYYFSQIGVGMWPWIALVPAAVGRAIATASTVTRESRVRFIVGLWAITAVGLFCLVQTKFHHYILPAVPALGILVAFWIDDLFAGRVRATAVIAVLGVCLIMLVARDLMDEHKQFIEMFVYRYDRPWPTNAPWSIDLSTEFLVFGLIFAAMLALLAVPRLRRCSLIGLGVGAFAFALWAMHVYMPKAATHWGMREAARTYYEQREVHGIDLVYYSPGQLAAEWEAYGGGADQGFQSRDYVIETFIPNTLALGQPKTIHVHIANRASKPQKTIDLVGPVVGLGEHEFTVHISAEEMAKLAPLLDEGRGKSAGGQKPWKAVNADRLIAWQLYWRGENFWSGDEIWARLEDMKTAYKQTDNVEFLKYLNEPSRAGRRFFVLTEAGRAANLKTILPTANAKATYEILDTTSNKFTLLAFTL